MQNLFHLALITLSLSACSGNTKTADQSSTTETPSDIPASTEQEVDLPTDPVLAISGLYTQGGHDRSWAVMVDFTYEEWNAHAAEWEGMMPPDGNVFDYPEEIAFDYFALDLDMDKKTFTSDWGKGRFAAGPSGMQMIFEEKEGMYDPETDKAMPLSLSKNKQTYTRADIAGFYRGSTWHSQGYVVIIEEANGGWVVKASETDGGNPTIDIIEDYPEQYDLKTFTTFELSDDLTTFNSDWGKGRFQRNAYGLKLIFEKLMGSYDPGLDQEDIQVRLTKVEEGEEEQ